MKWNNKLYASLFLTGIMAACSSTPKDAYTLEGKVTNPKLEGRTVYIIDAEKGDTRYDSARVTNGIFQFNGKQDEAVVRELLVQENDSDMFPVTLPFVLENGLIKVELGERVYVTNTDLNEEMMNFLIPGSGFRKGCHSRKHTNKVCRVHCTTGHEARKLRSGEIHLQCIQRQTDRRTTG